MPSRILALPLSVLIQSQHLQLVRELTSYHSARALLHERCLAVLGCSLHVRDTRTDIALHVILLFCLLSRADAFSSCYNLTEINMIGEVTTIAAYAFSNCSSLVDLAIEASVTTIGTCELKSYIWLNVYIILVYSAP